MNLVRKIAPVVLMLAASLPAAAAPAIGAAAPDFTLPAASGGTGDVALRELVGKSKGVVLLFVSVHCPYSNDYNSRMEALAKEYAAKGIAVIGINSNFNEKPDQVAEHAKKKSLSFPILKDAGNKIADLYGANRTPEAFLIDSKGNVVYHGRIDESREEGEARSHDLKNALNALLSGKSVPVAETKAFGCTIKRA
jgi:peroxiredoxin